MGSSLSVKARDTIRAAKKNKIEELILRDCNITKLPKRLFKKFTFLKKLSLSSNYISILPKEISVLQALEVLIIDKNELKELPLEILEIVTLIELDISTNHISTLPDSINVLRNLKKLDISANKITKLPDQFGELELTSLKMGQSELTEIPDVIFYITTLKTLHLPGNRIEKIPDKIIELKNLKDINFENNPISEFPFILSKLSLIKRLNFSNTKITTTENFPFDKFTDLRELDLSYCKLTKFSRNIGGCSKLENLNLSGNELKSIPKEIGYLYKTLNKLYLNDNKLDKLPGDINMLDPSIKLELNGNNLKHPFDLYKSSIVELFDALMAHTHAYGPSCVCEGEGLRTATKKKGTSFSIIAKDYIGRDRTTGGDFFEVSIIKESDEDIYQCDATIKDHKNGRYEVFYNPLQGGEYRIHVSCESIPFKDSPYKLVVFES